MTLTDTNWPLITNPHRDLIQPTCRNQWSGSHRCQEDYKSLIIHMKQQMKVHDNMKKTKALPYLHIGQEILYIMTRGDCFPGKVIQRGPEPRSYIVNASTAATQRHNRRQLEALDYIFTSNTFMIPRPSPKSVQYFAPQLSIHTYP